VKEESLDDDATDFPRVNESRLGRPNRYSWNARFERKPSGAVPLFEGINRYDQQSGAIQRHDHGAGRFGGEAVFAPRPGASREDDGWVMTYVHDEGAGSDELLILDARDLEAGPVARVRIPVRIPYGFHATWVDGTRIAD
jgi:carotenoid cleavage dioxygenase